MDNYKKQQSDIPEWLQNNKNYTPQSDKDTFVNKSILSLLKVIARIKAQDSDKKPKYPINVTLKLIFTFLLLVLISASRSFLFVMIVTVILLVVLSAMKADAIVKILKVSLGMTFITFIIMLPAVIWDNSFSCKLITLKVFTTVTAVGILSHSTKWAAIISALKSFFVPDIFIFVLDITVKYIVMLGEFTLNMLYALKLRSVGKNRSKYGSLSGVAGTMFIKSKEMAEDMYFAMECRGFTGEYHKYGGRLKFTAADGIYIIINAGIIFLYFYL